MTDVNDYCTMPIACSSYVDVKNIIIKLLCMVIVILIVYKYYITLHCICVLYIFVILIIYKLIHRAAAAIRTTRGRDLIIGTRLKIIYIKSL